MYPDTDLPPMPLEDSNLKAIADQLPDLPWAREERLIAAGLPDHFAQALALSPRFNLLVEMLDTSRTAKQARVLGWLFHELLKALRRKGVPVEDLTDADLRPLLLLFVHDRLHREGLAPVIERLAMQRVSGSDGALTKVLEEVFPEVARGESPVAIRQDALAPLFGETGDQQFAGEAQRIRALMRLAMVRFKGVAPGAEVFEAVAAWCRKQPAADERGGE